MTAQRLTYADRFDDKDKMQSNAVQSCRDAAAGAVGENGLPGAPLTVAARNTRAFNAVQLQLF